MNLEAKKQKLKSIKKIYSIIDLNRNISLIQIQKLSSKIRKIYDNVLFSKEIIEKIEDKYKINSLFSRDNSLFKNKKNTLWIFPSEKEKYVKNYYSKIENLLLQEASKEDYFITRGEIAKNVILKNNWDLVMNLEDSSNLEDDVLKIYYWIKNAILDKKIKEIIFTINSSNSSDSLKTKIFPIEDFKYKHKLSEEKKNWIDKNFDDITFYPNIEELLNVQIETYFKNIIKILFLESSFIIYKNKLIQENQIIKDVEEKIKTITRDIRKIERELEMEEIALIFSSNMEEEDES